MITLVTQFDDPSMRPSVATPSGASSSSCCCCCVATVIGVSVFSAIHVRNIRRRRLDESVREEPRPAAWPWPELLGFFAVTAALVVSGLLAAVTGVLIFLLPLVWGALLYAAYRGAGAETRVANTIATVIFGLVFGAIEFAIWLGILSG